LAKAIEWTIPSSGAFAGRRDLGGQAVEGALLLDVAHEHGPAAEQRLQRLAALARSARCR
jgi:hypothetical protein